MKSIFYKSLALVALFASATSCSDDVEYVNTTPSAVTSFYEPADGKVLKLVASNSASLLFEWEPAHATDGVTPQYELAFYKADDTKNPIYKVTSDNNGTKSLATVSHKTLTKVMAAAGVGMGETGTIKWGVLSYSGVNSKPSTVLHDLTMTRFIGFDEVPNSLYITGEASEGGNDINKAVAFNKIDAETFEIFTKLNAGQKFFFTDDLNGINTYSIKGSSVIEGEDGGATADKNGVYRIVLDFSTASATIREIEGVYLRFTDFGDFNVGLSDGHWAFQFDYAGNGVFQKKTNITTKDTGWSWDPYESRYNVQVNYADGTITSWAPTNTGLDSKPNTPLDITSDYYNMQEFSGTVGYKWKLSSSAYQKDIIFSVYFNFEHGKYTHFYEVL